MEKRVGGNIVWSHGASNARGVAILVKPGSHKTITEEHRDDTGRLLLVKVKTQDVNLVPQHLNYEGSQINCYANKKKILQKEAVVVGGDWNFIMDPNIDRKRGMHKLRHK